jgi:hypothetical protein
MRFRWALPFALAASTALTGTAFAAPPIPGPPVVSPLDTVETLTGSVQVRGDGRTFTVTVARPGGGVLRKFELEADQPAGPAVQLDAKAAEVHFWNRHLVVVAPGERKALHFSMLGPERSIRPNLGGPQIDSASALAELDTLLRTTYDLTRIESVTSIISKNAQALKVQAGIGQQTGAEVDNQDYGGGLGTCGSSCTITCGDNSGCSANCTPPRCSSCSCPASCSCR